MMKIIGDRVMLERIEKEATGGFEAVEVINDFVSRGRVVQVGSPITRGYVQGMTMASFSPSTPVKDDLAEGNIVLFAKFSPDTQEVKIDGTDYKVVALSDIIAIEEYA